MITTAITLIGMGCCLGIGFNLSKKVTNQVDYAIHILKEKVRKAPKA